MSSPRSTSESAFIGGCGTNIAWASTPLRRMLARISEAELVAGSVRLNPQQILTDGQPLADDWIRQTDQLEVLERVLPAGVPRSHDEIVQWFDEGLRQLRDADVLRSYFAAVNPKRALAGARTESASGAPEWSASDETADS